MEHVDEVIDKVIISDEPVLKNFVVPKADYTLDADPVPKNIN